MCHADSGSTEFMLTQEYVRFIFQPVTQWTKQLDFCLFCCLYGVWLFSSVLSQRCRQLLCRYLHIFPDAIPHLRTSWCEREDVC
ncbi:hypothetical protein FQN60_012158 [Etheostoma spectabile]|uniref:Uncharacterized protein n=1 Tax=Etheostoma spectabile TaxID=54343 RepID=A0A5J5DPA2_9PERO|nr:hypothetical protein FQN60_012158 [Etheostoma spectabile]